MIKRLLFLTLTILASTILKAQEAPNVGNSAQQTAGGQSAGKLMNTPVNLFTGIPDIGVPIYNYDGADGMNLNVSLSYHAGGIQVLEQPSIVGLGWALNAGGAITRIIRGAPDDLATYGFMYAGAIPTDYRSDGSKYYYDSLDAQQDIFQFSCGAGSGRFYLGKNGQIAIVPDSRISITYSTNYSGGISSFTLRGEDGCRYIFADLESSKISNQTTTDNIKSYYTDKAYTSSWYLSKIIAPFSTDTINFKYSTKETSASFPLTQSAFGNIATQTTTQTYKPSAYNFSLSKILDSIMLPGNKKVKFFYSSKYSNFQTVFIDGVPVLQPMDSAIVLNNIYITDTVLRKGFNLGTDSKFLLSVTPFTAKEKMPGYVFSYYPYTGVTKQIGNENQQELNYAARDHWGYYNGKYNNGGVFPTLNSWMGADRSLDFSKAVMNSMQYTYLPGGGFVNYEYELNDHVPYTKSSQQITVNNSYNTLTSATLTDIISPQRGISITLDNSSLDRTGTPPLSSTSTILTCNIVDPANTNTIFASYTLNLAELYYTGFKLWNFSIPDGTYKLQTILSGGTVTGGTFPVVFNWENKLVDNTITAVPAGGIRVKRITRKNASDDLNPITTEYKYITTDGRSSGFLGDIPRYDYAFRNKLVNGSTTITDYTVISSEPVGNMDYAQGSPVGYSRVEVIKGTAASNIGKEVYEFISPKDISVNYTTASNPYGPTDIKEWALGLPKRTTVYDNTGRLMKSTVPTYSFLSTSYNNSNFKSIKLNHNATYTTVSGGNSLVQRVFTAQEYYPSGGRVVLTQTIDTVFHSDGSIQINSQSFEYDATYYNNVIKVTSSYDRTRGLFLETRMYYPFNYTLSGVIGKLKDSGISTSVIATEKWITGDGNNRIVSGSITDLQQLSGGYIRPSTIYSLETNKPIAQATIGAFNPAILNRNSTYFKPQATMPVYDAEGNILQTTSSLSGQSESVIMDYDNRYAIAKVSNAAYIDIAYTSFESDGSGNWVVNGTARDNTTAITGRKSYNLSGGTVTKAGLSTSKTYLISFWAKTGAAVTVNSVSAGSSIAQHKGWNLYNKMVSGISSVTIGGNGIVDELRLHPKDANMVTTTYEPMVGVISSCDANNTIVYNEYDNLNRLKIVRDNDGNIVKKMEYSDVAMPVDINQVWSNASQVRWGTGSNNCAYDSLFTDTNPFSATFKQGIWIYKGINCCASPSHINDITYKVVNGACELGLRWNSSTSQGYVNGVLKWKCIYYYKWSDGSRTDADISTGNVMDDFVEFNDAPCPLGYGY